MGGWEADDDLHCTYAGSYRGADNDPTVDLVIVFTFHQGNVEIDSLCPIA